jgi:hypothetical protein
MTTTKTRSARCPKHRTYRAIRRPTADCEPCRLLWARARRAAAPRSDLLTPDRILALRPCRDYPAKRVRALVPTCGVYAADAAPLLAALPRRDARWVLSRLLCVEDRVTWARGCAERAGGYAATAAAADADAAADAADAAYYAATAAAADASYAADAAAEHARACVDGLRLLSARAKLDA